MENLVDITKVIQTKKIKKDMDKLDARASYVCLEKCLKYLEMNKMKELDDIKKQIKDVMKTLAEIGK